MISFILRHEFQHSFFTQLAFIADVPLFPLNATFHNAKKKMSLVEIPNSVSQQNTIHFDLDHKADVIDPFFESWPHKPSDEKYPNVLAELFQKFNLCMTVGFVPFVHV